MDKFFENFWSWMTEQDSQAFAPKKDKAYQKSDKRSSGEQQAAMMDVPLENAAHSKKDPMLLSPSSQHKSAPESGLESPLQGRGKRPPL